VLATKVLGRMGPGVNQIGLSRAHILSAVNASLQRLQLDHIDLYQTVGCWSSRVAIAARR
jgi:aryl-alcohol dehydrogenase-like predicted oxidoreductase